MGKTIRALRKARGLTLRQLASLAQIPASSLSDMELGHMELKVADLERLALALGLSTTALLGAPEVHQLLEETLHA